MKNYPLLDVRVTTPRLELCGATDALLDELADLVRAGRTHAEPAPYDDPMSFHESDPEVRVTRWLRAIWRRRGSVEPDAWRLYLVVVVDGHPVGEQTLDGLSFATLGTVGTFSWLSSNAVSRGLGYEPNGTDWATRRGEPGLLNRWRLTREAWEQSRREDIELHGVQACRALLPLT